MRFLPIIRNYLGGKIEESVKEESIDRLDRIPSPVMNNHNNTVVDNADPAFSDEETEPPPAKIIKIEVEEVEEEAEEEKDVPVGTYFYLIFSYYRRVRRVLIIIVDS